MLRASLSVCVCLSVNRSSQRAVSLEKHWRGDDCCQGNRHGWWAFSSSSSLFPESGITCFELSQTNRSSPDVAFRQFPTSLLSVFVCLCLCACVSVYLCLSVSLSMLNCPEGVVCGFSLARAITHTRTSENNSFLFSDNCQTCPTIRPSLPSSLRPSSALFYLRPSFIFVRYLSSSVLYLRSWFALIRQSDLVFSECA